ARRPGHVMPDQRPAKAKSSDERAHRAEADARGETGAAHVDAWEPPSDAYVDALPPSTCVIERVAAFGAPSRARQPKRPAADAPTATWLPSVERVLALPAREKAAIRAHLLG